MRQPLRFRSVNSRSLVRPDWPESEQKSPRVSSGATEAHCLELPCVDHLSTSDSCAVVDKGTTASYFVGLLDSGLVGLVASVARGC